MRVLAHVHYAWPAQRGGSETSTHRALAWLVSRGHEVRAIVTRHRAGTCDGVQYARVMHRDWAALWEWCDIAWAQQGSSSDAAELGDLHDRPVVHWAHNWHWYDLHAQALEQRRDRDLVLWNSHALADSQAPRWAGRSMVVHPPVWPHDWALDAPGDAVTQINLSALKGGATFWSLAEALPELLFVGVAGGWGHQIDRKGRDYLVRDAPAQLARRAPPNVTILGETPDMRAVYAMSRIVIMPTRQVSEIQPGESYGLVAAEATSAGLPVIASDSPGMREALGHAGLLLDPDNVDCWTEAVLDVMTDPGIYEELVLQAKTRAVELDPTVELEALELAMGGLCGS